MHISSVLNANEINAVFRLYGSQEMLKSVLFSRVWN